MATIDSRAIEHRGYLILVAHRHPFYQGIIKPMKAGMTQIDWTLNPIWAANRTEAEMDARKRIDKALAQATLSTR